MITAIGTASALYTDRFGLTVQGAKIAILSRTRMTKGKTMNEFMLCFAVTICSVSLAIGIFFVIDAVTQLCIKPWQKTIETATPKSLEEIWNLMN